MLEQTTSSVLSSAGESSVCYTMLKLLEGKLDEEEGGRHPGYLFKKCLIQERSSYGCVVGPILGVLVS